MVWIPLDLLSSLHFRLALVAVLNGKMNDFMCVVALVCSSFVTVSSGTHRRTPFHPLGQTEIPFVQLGNLLASRFLGGLTSE